ncbi:unnamed protein product, partial [Brenthis ino]
MNTLILVSTLLVFTSAAQLPSATYLPQGGPGSQISRPQGSGNLGAKPPSNTYAPQGSGSSGAGDVNTRPQQEVEKNAAILKLDQAIEENSFHYSYETSNGIQGEESGDVTQTRGGFAYKGDDGKIYSVTFTAGEDGYRPQGDHLPVPPPTPDEILLALKQNERDEAAGIFDDGKYHPENDNQGKPGSGSFGSTNHQGSYDANSGYSY